MTEDQTVEKAQCHIIHVSTVKNALNDLDNESGLSFSPKRTVSLLCMYKGIFYSKFGLNHCDAVDVSLLLSLACWMVNDSCLS